MIVDENMIDKVAKVARLELTKEERDEFLPQLQECLKNFSTLAEVNTEGVEPKFHPVPLANALREDTEQPCLSQEQALELTNHKKDGYFTGPKSV